MAESKNILLKIEDVKMHFPLKKTSFFEKGRSYVKAVDGVTLDIYEGETFGLVGESGCGKSTLGRVILQLYGQTAGSIRYGGVTLNDYAPGYAFKDAAKVVKVRGTAEDIAKNFPGQVKLLGGLLLTDDLNTAARALRETLTAIKEVNRLQTAIHLLNLKHTAYRESEELLTDMVEKEQEKLTADNPNDKVFQFHIRLDTKRGTLMTGTHKGLSASEQKRLAKIEKEIDALGGRLAEAEAVRDRLNAALEDLRSRCEGRPGFALLEELRDVSVDLSRMTKVEMRRLRRDLQIVFQDPYSSLNTRFTVGQLISEAVVAHNMFGRGTGQLEEYVLGVMDKCGLQNYFLHRYPHQFSGGQRQRIGIARALALQPRFVVCDEAVSALDVSIQSQIINLLIDLKESSNLTYLFISHDLSTVKFISDRVGVMYLGNIIELGDSDEIFAEPLHPYTNVLLEAIPTTEEASKKELQVIEGDIPSPINPPPGCKFHTRCRYAAERCKTDVPEWREYRPKHWVACHFPITKP